MVVSIQYIWDNGTQQPYMQFQQQRDNGKRRYCVWFEVRNHYGHGLMPKPNHQTKRVYRE